MPSATRRTDPSGLGGMSGRHVGAWRSASGLPNRSPRSPLRSGAAILSGLVLGLSSLGCGEEPAPPALAARPVKIVELGSDGTSAAREYPGEISPATNAQVGFEVPGKVIEFPVREGQEVAEGEVLAKLDPRDYDAALDAEKE